MLPTDRFARWVLIAVTAFSILLLIGPSLIVIAISFEPRAYIAFPPSGFRPAVSGGLREPAAPDSILVSVRISLAVMAICLLIGVPAAFASIRGTFRAGRR